MVYWWSSVNLKYIFGTFWVLWQKRGHYWIASLSSCPFCLAKELQCPTSGTVPLVTQRLRRDGDKGNVLLLAKLSNLLLLAGSFVILDDWCPHLVRVTPYWWLLKRGERWGWAAGRWSVAPPPGIFNQLPKKTLFVLRSWGFACLAMMERAREPMTITI